MTLVRTEARACTIARQMTAAYRSSERRFHSAMEHAASGMALLDRKGDIVEANPALSHIVGVDVSLLAGRSLASLFETEEPASIDTQQLQAIGGGAHRVTRNLRRSDGAIRHAHLAYTAIPGGDASGISRLVQVEDITERLRAEAEVHALNRTLESRVDAGVECCQQRTRIVRLQRLARPAYAAAFDRRLQPSAGWPVLGRPRRCRQGLSGPYPQCRDADG
ncbi:MAG: PAS domain S-box protein [Luteimonas sp.]